MWFKNLTLLRFREPFTLSPEELAEKMGRAAFHPCTSQEMISCGWVPPLGLKARDLVHVSSGCVLLCLQAEEKILPAAVIRDGVAERVAGIEDQQNRIVRQHEKRVIRDEVLQDLLPRAFTRRRQSYAYIDTRGGWLVIDGANRKTVEEITHLLRENLGSLPVVPPKVLNAPAVTMTHWLESGELIGNFEVGDECELRGSSEAGAVVRCKGQDLNGAEIQAHLEAGKQVTRLALIWNERVAFILDEDLGIRRLRFLNLVKERLDSRDLDSAEAVFDAQFTLMCGELSMLLPELLKAFGGENRSL